MINPNPSPLSNLSPEQAGHLLALLETHPIREVAAIIAKDPPEGFGIRTHTTTLHRYYARHRAETREQDIDIARLLAQPQAVGPMDSAAGSLASEWAFQIAAKPRRNLSGFKALSRWVLKQRELEQREREIKLLSERLALDREKFEFNAARQAIIHYATIDRIATDPAQDNEAKIRAVRQQLFGGSAPE